MMSCTLMALGFRCKFQTADSVSSAVVCSIIVSSSVQHFHRSWCTQVFNIFTQCHEVITILSCLNVQAVEYRHISFLDQRSQPGLHFSNMLQTPEESSSEMGSHLRLASVRDDRCSSPSFSCTLSVRKYLSSKWIKRDVSRTKIHLDTYPFIYFDDKYFRTEGVPS